MTKTMRALRRQAGGMKALVPDRKCDHYVGHGASPERPLRWRLIRQSDHGKALSTDRMLRFAYCPLCGEKL